MSAAYQKMASLVANLQSVVVKQQAIINTLMAKTQAQELTLEEVSHKSALHPLKVEEEITPSSQHPSGSGDASSETTDETCDATKEIRAPRIRRRNGFKNDHKIKRPRNDEDSDSESIEGKLTSTKGSANDKKNNSSKAKHLWVNYGRRILEYAMNETQGSMQERVKLLVGKLNSKKDFERAFQVTEEDSEDDKLFKTLLGKLAIFFVKNKASPTFESSKYKQEMITQRHTVAAWIERLIGP